MALPPGIVEQVRSTLDSLYQLLHRCVVVQDFKGGLEIAEQILFFEPNSTAARSFIDIASEHISGGSSSNTATGDRVLRLNSPPSAPTSKSGSRSARAPTTPSRLINSTSSRPQRLVPIPSSSSTASKARKRRKTHPLPTSPSTDERAVYSPDRDASAADADADADADASDGSESESSDAGSSSDVSEDGEGGGDEKQGRPGGRGVGGDGSGATMSADGAAAPDSLAGIMHRLDVFEQMQREGKIPRMPTLSKGVWRSADGDAVVVDGGSGERKGSLGVNDSGSVGGVGSDAGRGAPVGRAPGLPGQPSHVGASANPLLDADMSPWSAKAAVKSPLLS